MTASSAEAPDDNRNGTVCTTYQLLIVLERPLQLRIGALGEHTLPSGYYVYTGSARQNLRARLQRHLRREKTRRWHVDYVLTQPHAHVVDVSVSAQPECALNASVGGTVVVPRFGASDCRADCGSHLRRIPSGRIRQP